MKRCKTILAAVVLCGLFVTAHGADLQVKSSKPMSAQQVDKAFDNIFASQKKLTHIEGKVITTIKGSGSGLFKKDKKTIAAVKAQLPNRFLYIDQGELGGKTPESEYAYTLLDGIYFWEMKPTPGKKGAYETSMREMGNTADRDVDIVAFLIGGENITTGKDLRELYNITGSEETYTDGSTSYHFVLETTPGKERKKRKEHVDLWIKTGEVIPWKIHNIRLEPVAKANDIFGNGASSSKTEYKKSESTKELVDIKSNLSTPPLPKFPYTTFYFGTLLRSHPNNQITNSKGAIVDRMTQQKVLTNILTILQED